MTSEAAAEQECHRVLADQDRRGYLAHPETAERCLTSSSVGPVATQPGSSGLQAE
jgi:hypothetical protein